MSDNFSQSISVRILFPILSALLIGLVCISTGSYIIEKESLNKLKYLSENQTNVIESHIETLEKTADDLSYVISNMAYTKKLKGESFYSSNYVEQLKSVIKKVSDRYGDIVEISLFLTPEYSFDNKQNKYFYAKSSINDTLKIQKTEKNNEKIHFKNNYKGIWKESTVKEFSGIHNISYEKPIILNNELIGFIKVNISLTEIAKFLSGIHSYNNDHSVLLDKKYNVIACSTEDNNKLLPNLVAERLKKENNGIIIHKTNGVKMISSFNKLEDGFTYVITAPKDEVFEQKYHLQRLIAGIIFMGIFSVILIVLNI